MLNDNMLEVKSTAVEAVHWDPETLVLTVRYKTGGLYKYFGVSDMDFADLFFNGSIGRAFAKHINNFEFEKIG